MGDWFSRRGLRLGGGGFLRLICLLFRGCLLVRPSLDFVYVSLLVAFVAGLLGVAVIVVRME